MDSGRYSVTTSSSSTTSITLKNMSLYIGREASKVRFLISSIFYPFHVFSFFFVNFNFNVWMLFPAMEENLRRNNHGNQPPCGELEVPSRWFSFSGFFSSFLLIIFLATLL